MWLIRLIGRILLICLIRLIHPIGLIRLIGRILLICPIRLIYPIGLILPIFLICLIYLIRSRQCSAQPTPNLR